MNPLCKQCVFYKPARAGQCTRFIVYRGRGKVVYEFAENARQDKKKCGPDGKLFLSRVTHLDEEESVFRE